MSTSFVDQLMNEAADQTRIHGILARGCEHVVKVRPQLRDLLCEFDPEEDMHYTTLDQHVRHVSHAVERVLAVSQVPSICVQTLGEWHRHASNMADIRGQVYSVMDEKIKRQIQGLYETVVGFSEDVQRSPLNRTVSAFISWRMRAANKPQVMKMIDYAIGMLGEPETAILFTTDRNGNPNVQIRSYGDENP